MALCMVRQLIVAKDGIMHVWNYKFSIHCNCWCLPVWVSDSCVWYWITCHSVLDL